MRANILISAICLMSTGCGVCSYPIGLKDPVDPLRLGDPCIEYRSQLALFADPARTTPADNTRELTIYNACEGPLRIYSMELEAPGPYRLGSIPSVLLQQNGYVDITVTLFTDEPGTWPNAVIIRSSDPETPIARVVLAANSASPELHVGTEPLEDAPLVGCEATRTLRLSNLGTADLRIRDFQIDVDEWSDVVVELDAEWAESLPTVIPAHDAEVSLAVDVHYTPLHHLPSYATLSITSDDPVTPVRRVQMDFTGVAHAHGLDVHIATHPGLGADDPPYPLSQAAIPGTLLVQVDGVPVELGWDYDVGSNSVHFYRHAPSAGSSVQLEYEVAPDCD